MQFKLTGRCWRARPQTKPACAAIGWGRLSSALAGAALINTSLLASGPVAAQHSDSTLSNSTLEEVVVTARKLEENLQDTPVAVSAFSQAAIERLGLVSTEDLGRVTPNLQFKSFAPLSGNNAAAQVFIRGIGQSDASGGVDPGVGIYLDGVYLGRSVGGVIQLRDIDNVQVVRGPQGTYFGRNTIGGAVLLTSTAPGNELQGEVRAGVGDNGLREWFGAVDVPFSERVAARISYGSRQRDGYVERVSDGIDLGNEDHYTVSGSLHWQVSDDFSLVARGDFTEEDENGSPFVFAAINESAAFPLAQSFVAGCPAISLEPLSVAPDVVDQRCANDATWDLGEFTNGGNAPASSYLKNQGASITANWQASDRLALKYIGADRSLEWFGARDADNTSLNILSTQYESQSDQVSHELQITYSGESLQGVSGIYLYEEDIRDFLLVPFGVLTIPNQVLVDYQLAELSTDSEAYYTNWTWSVSSNWSISAGARFTDEAKSISLRATSAGLIDLPLQGRLNVGEPEPPFYVQEGPHNLDFSATTYSLSSQYRFSPSVMAYVSWAEGFKSGGFNQRYNAPLPDALPIPFDSEEADSYEIGFKSDLGGRWRVNGALFKTDYKNIQLTYRLGIVPILFNAAEASIEGAELEVAYADRHWSVDGSLGYLKDAINSVAEIPQAEASLGPDSDLPFTPEISASLGAGYSFDYDGLRVTPRLNVSFTDKQYFDAANTDEIAQSNGETLTNLSLTVADAQSRWRLVAGIDNLTNESYATAGNSSLATGSGYAEVIYNRPRSYYLSGGYHF